MHTATLVSLYHSTMEARLVILAVLLVSSCFYVVDAEFLYNHVYPKQEELKGLGLKCIPGRTIVKIGKLPLISNSLDEDSESDSDNGKPPPAPNEDSDNDSKIKKRRLALKLTKVDSDGDGKIRKPPQVPNSLEKDSNGDSRIGKSPQASNLIERDSDRDGKIGKLPRALHLTEKYLDSGSKIGKPPRAPNFTKKDSDGDGRRTHMRFKTDDETCQVCVCSVDGKDQYCSNRPVKNVNECLMMTKLMKKFHEEKPFEHEKSLPFRIRRDYLWHNDEIPYNAKAKCLRGHSYYSNSINAQNTDIDIDSSIESLLDYSNKNICFYCVCNVDGRSVGCISRAPWYCEYYRNIREYDSMRDRYRHIFHQDRPVYFRQLSYRLRRTMDGGMFDLVDTVGNDSPPESCVPFVSEYTDCTEENQCDGCKKCSCDANSQWSCETIQKCAPGEESDLDDQDVNNALENMLIELKEKDDMERAHSQTPLVPKPPSLEEKRQLDERELLLELKEKNFEDEILELMRGKRSVDAHDHDDNGTVTFYHTKDELNEDTLKTHNITGTLKAKKFDPKLITRRANLSHNSSNSLQIEYTQPKIYKHHITDNKIDTPQEEKIDSFIQDQLSSLIGNHSLDEKNQNLSQVVVSEMSVGNEVVGDHSAPIISNITFQQQNDTITAMALIAGNLLNKLWNMEKDSIGDAIDIEMLRHEKISDLIELFKEPLNLRQQLFLKNALEQLSTAIDKNKDVQSISLCENVEKVKQADAARIQKDCDKRKNNRTNNTTNATNTEAVNKITKVLDLIKKYEQLQKRIEILKAAAPSAKTNSYVTTDEQSFLNNYGTVLNTITKLLLPKHNGKKLKSAIQNSNSLTKDEEVKQKLKDLYNLDLGNMNVSAKDKIVLDYLTHIQSRPDCLLKKQKSFIIPAVEGNVLLNLSEFFKIKSMPDLLKLFGIENHPVLRIDEPETTVIPIETSTTVKTTDAADIDTASAESINIANKSKFESRKEKLKEHLKTILEDIIELQNMEGKSADGKNVKVADALPCIYNLLDNTKNRESEKLEKVTKSKLNEMLDKASKKHPKPNATEKVKEIFDNLKQDLKFTQTRRTNAISIPRPKSAIVWERVIKNLDGKKMKTRRTMSDIPKSLKEIKKSLTNLDSTRSNSYKNYAYLYEVPAADRYLLLKTFQSEVNKLIGVLQDIKATIDPMTVLEIEDSQEIKNFIDNAAKNLNLNENIVKNLDKPKGLNPQSNFSVMNNNFKLKRARVRPVKITENISLKNDGLKLTREQLIIQLIKNRVQNYLKAKEMYRNNENDINYDIAKKILTNVETGNYELAKELYKIFASRKYKGFSSYNRGDTSTGHSKNTQILDRGQIRKEPLIQFDDSNNKDLLINQDQVIKQLLNLRRNIKI